jgi:hypothetical protein
MAMSNTTRAELAANIQKHQWLVFNITGSSEAELRFSYTVGLFETFGHPEVVISGLPNDVALAILNDIGSDVAKGVSREAEVLYDDILAGYPCVFKPVPTHVYEAYFGRALVFYEGLIFPFCSACGPML